MADYLKRVQSRLKSQGYTVGRQEIIDQLLEIDISYFDINDDNISESVQNLIELIKSKTPSQLQTTVPTQEIFDNYDDYNISEEDLDTNIQISNQIKNPGIVLSDTQKQNLVRSTSNQLGITLVGNEVKEIAQTIGSQFGDRREMLSAITEALTVYAAHITAQEQEIVSEAIDRVRCQMSSSNSNIKQAFNTLEGDINQSNLDLKSVKDDLLRIFAIN